MTKSHILEEIRRTAKANDGVPLGWRRFREETGIGYYDWFGKFWTRWGDAIQEAGFKRNCMSEAYDDDYLVEKLALLTRQLGRVPVRGDMLLERRRDPTFPSEKTYRRLGAKSQLVSRVISYCERTAGYDDIAAAWNEVPVADEPTDIEPDGVALPARGYVYLFKHGSRREYKIGRTVNPLRREGEIRIELPEKLIPIHSIETDDPTGIENYWHTRFADKRKEGEWFALTAEDVRAFKRWKRIY